MEQLFILLLVGAFALMKWALKGGRDQEYLEPDASKKTTTARPSGHRAPADSEEERMRKFMEALGIPPTSAPPPKVAPRAEAPERPLAPVQPPPVLIPQIPRSAKREQTRKRARPAHEVTPPRKQAPPVPPSPEPVEIPARVVVAPEPVMAVVEFPGTETSPGGARERASQPLDIRALVRSPESLRAAIILREVLGPPRGLQQPGLQSAGF